MRSKNRAVEIVGYVLLALLGLLLLGSACVSSFKNDRMIIGKADYNRLLNEKAELQEELDWYRLQEERLIEAREEVGVEGLKYDRLKDYYSLPKDEYEIVQYNVLSKFYAYNENMVLHRASAIRTTEVVIYEVFYKDLATRYTTRDSEIEKEINELCLAIKEEWLLNGYTKDVNVLALDFSDTEFVYLSSRNGVIDFNIIDPQKQDDISEMQNVKSQSYGE